MQIDLTPAEITRIIEALESENDQAIDTRRDLPQDELAEHDAWIEEGAALITKLIEASE